MQVCGHLKTPAPVRGLKCRRHSRRRHQVLPPARSHHWSLPWLEEGPSVICWLGVKDLGRLDATCSTLRDLNGQPRGAWHSLGLHTFHGLELEYFGRFISFDMSSPRSWRSNYKFFQRELAMFSPSGSGEICGVERPDEVVHFRCRLRTDLLASRPDKYVYVEVDVESNADNLSLALLVDLEGADRSSVTFSPETGAVLRERQGRDSAIEGSFIHLLPASGCRFVGSIGLCVHHGHLAFFRRWAGSDVWESTGFCTDLTWAQGHQLSMCLAFRDDGAYRVRITRVGHPPLIPSMSKASQQKWSSLYGDELLAI